MEFNKENYTTHEEVKTRINALKDLVERSQDIAEIETATEELKLLQERDQELADIEERKAAVKAIEAGTMTAAVLERNTAMPQMENFTVESKEYRDAWAKTLMREQLTEVEERAFSGVTTATQGLPMPTEIVGDIWNLIEEAHPILGDITRYSTGTVIEVNALSGITAGDAKKTDEGVANTEEKNNYVKVTLSGKDFSKWIEFSYAAAKMTVSSFIEFIKNEIADRIGAAIAADIVAQIKSDMAAANKKTYGKGKTVAFTDITAAFGALKRVSQRVVYVNNSTLYNHLVSMVDDNKRPIYQVNVNEEAMGALLGAVVKIEDAVEDGEILIGDPKRIVQNVVQDIIVEEDREIKGHTIIYSGYARAEAKLIDGASFVSLSEASA